MARCPASCPRFCEIGCTNGVPLYNLQELSVEPEPQDGARRGDLPDRDPPTYALHAVAGDGSMETLLTGMELAEARSVCQVLADSAGLEVSLPDETPAVSAICRLRR